MRDSSSSRPAEIIFLVEEDPDGGFRTRALGESIFTDAENMETLRENIRDAVLCHFPEPEERPKIIRLHEVREEVFEL